MSCDDPNWLCDLFTFAKIVYNTNTSCKWSKWSIERESIKVSYYYKRRASLNERQHYVKYNLKKKKRSTNNIFIENWAHHLYTKENNKKPVDNNTKERKKKKKSHLLAALYYCCVELFILASHRVNRMIIIRMRDERKTYIIFGGKGERRTRQNKVSFELAVKNTERLR